MSAGAKKRNILETNNTNTVKAALIKIIYMHRTATVEWEQLPVAGRYWTNGDIRHIIIEHHIRVLMTIKIETLKSEHGRARETDVFRTGDTA